MKVNGKVVTLVCKRFGRQQVFGFTGEDVIKPTRHAALCAMSDSGTSFQDSFAERNTMKRSIVLSFILLLLSYFAWSQGSACPAGHEDLCRPPSPSPTPRPSPSPSRPSEPDDDDNNGPRSTWRPFTQQELHEQYLAKIHAEVKKHNDDGDVARARYVAGGFKNNTDYNLAMDAYNASLGEQSGNLGGIIGITALMIDGDQDRQALKVIQEVLAGNHTVKKNKPILEWFKLENDGEIATVDRLDFNGQCPNSVHTSATGNGGAVDPSVDVIGHAKLCREWEKRLVKEDKLYKETQAKYHAKYHQN
jgi:hypothetical protein